MDLIQLLAEMFDHRVMIACVTLLFTVCAGIYAFSVTPVYQADALVQVEAKQGNAAQEPDLAQIRSLTRCRSRTFTP
jgi:tyrosine-protein kinase Etk/Wzc